MQVSKLLVIALVCAVLISGAEMSAGAGAAAVPRALLRASVLPAAGTAAAVPHAVAAGGGTIDGCCWPMRLECCPDDDAAAAPASDDSP